MTKPLADDFDAIRQRLAELEADKKPAEEPKAWPMYAGAEGTDEIDYPMLGVQSTWVMPAFDVPVRWVEAYFIAFDAVLGLPVWANSPVFEKKPYRGFEPCSEERARELNNKFSALGPYAVEYLKEQIDSRCVVIASQSYVAPDSDPA